MDGVAAPPWSSALEHLLDGTLARRRGSGAAVIDLAGSPTVSHLELYHRAVQAADTMRQLGWQQGDVAILTLPEPDLVVAVVACLRLGICCVVAEPGDDPQPPVDPARRLHRVDRLPTMAPDPAVIDLTDRLPPPPESPAYLVATSGTSGPPKWIEVPRSALAALVAGLPGRYGLGPTDRVLRFFSRSGDTVFEELLVTLAAGAAVVVGHRPGSFPALDDDITRAGVTVLQLPTSYWHPAVDHWLERGGPPRGVRLVIAGSEAMRPDVVARWAGLHRRPALVNAYGPSEVTITAMVHPVDPATDVHDVPIGTALPGVDTLLVDDGRVVEGEGTGELWLGGAQLASGYRAAADAEHARFVTDGPVAGRWYRTGDLVRRRPDGLMVHLGRLDRQVKIAGHRVEPEQIEHHLQAHPGVAVAVVRPVHAGLHLELTANVVLRAGAQVDGDALRRHLASRVPSAAIPTEIRFVTALERTATGKLDRAARPASPSSVGLVGDLSAGFPAWWQAVTGRPPSPTDRLVDAGVPSLRILQALADLEERFGRRLDLRTVVSSTFAELSALADASPGPSAPSPASGPTTSMEPGPVGVNATEVWLAGQVLGGRAVPVVSAAVRLGVDRVSAREAIVAVTARHSALHARWQFDAAGNLLVVADAVEPAVDEEATGDPRQIATEQARRLAADPDGPQIRWTLLDEAPDGASQSGTVVVLVGHHALLDDGAVAVVAEELADAAHGRLTDATAPGPVELARAVAPDPAAQQRWAERVAPSPDDGDWFADRWPTGTLTGIARRHPVALRESTATAVAAALAAAGVSATTAAAALAAVAGHHLAGARRQWLAVPLTQRLGRDRLRAVGYALATVPVPVEVRAAEPWSGLLSRLHRQLWECSADALVDQSEVLAASGRGRLGPIAVAGRTEEALADAEWVDASVDETVTPTPLVVEVVLRGSGVAGPVCEVAVLADEGLERHDVDATVAAVADACRRLALDTDGAAVADAAPVVHGTPGPPWWTSMALADLALGHLRAAGGATVVSEATRGWSGDELVNAVNDLVARLTGAGVGAGHLVVLDLPAGGELVAAVVACVSLGVVYVPVEPGAPENWRAEAASRTGAAWIVRPGLTLDPTGVAGRPWRGPKPAAYVMFTSGSTGTPRGVVVPIEAITRLVLRQPCLGVTADSVVALASNPAFDASTFELWSALTHGARLAVPPPTVRHNPVALARWLRHEQVSVLFITTALFALVAEVAPDALATLDTVLVGGEAMDPAWIDAIWHRGRPRRLLHVYGPTETTTFATYHEVTGPTAGRPVPIGGPLETTVVSVRRQDGAGTPDGMVGELWVGGPGVADPFDPEPDGRWTSDGTGAWYRTGDLVRWVAGGAVFVGRQDDQVKVRGYRIELSDVERALTTLPGVRRAVAVVDGRGPGARLVAVATVDPGVDAAGLTVALARTCRPHLVPSVIRVVERIPLSPNGKVDRAAVLALARKATAPAPLPDANSVAAVVCARITGSLTHPATPLVELGLTSLQWIRLLHALELATGSRLALAELMGCERVADIDRLIAGAAPSTAPDGVTVIRDGVGTPIWLVSGTSAPPTIWSEVIGHIPPRRPLWSPDFAGFDHPRSVVDLATHLLRLAEERPGSFDIVGYSLGALIAVEAARRCDRPCELILLDPILHVRASRLRAPQRPERGSVRRILRRLGARRAAALGIDDPSVRQTAAAINDKRAQRRYAAPSFDGPCRLVQAQDGVTGRQRRLQERALRLWLRNAQWTAVPGAHRGDSSILTGTGASAIAQLIAEENAQ